MGLFLEILGVGRADTAAVRGSLAKYALRRMRTFEQFRANSWDDDVVVLSPGANGHSVLFAWMPFEMTHDASQFVSEDLQAPVFFFHVHDGDFWLYDFFDNGRLVDQFNPIPDYWSDCISEQDRSDCAGNPRLIAEHWPNAKEDELEKYLVNWNLDDLHQKGAYPTDEFAYGSEYQFIDFMRKLGLVYPVSGHSAYPNGVRIPATRPASEQEALQYDVKFLGETYRFAAKVP